MNSKQKTAKEGTKKKAQQRLIFLSNPTWGRIEYFIQMSFTNVSIQIKRLYAIGNRNMENKFNALTENKTQFQIILSENQLNKAEDFSTVCQKGFKYPLNFNFGKIQMKNFQKQAEDYYQVLISKAAVGKTYIYPSKNISQSVPFEQKPQLMSAHFDSVFIYDDNQSNKQFKSSYLIYTPQKLCLPQFIVHFVIHPGRYRQLQEKIICELCQDNLARKYCETQDTYLCISCDNSHHHNRLAHKHKRSELTEKPKILGYCTVHPSLKMELYCMQCNRTLCINCKVKGDHSSGEMLMHTLVRITQKYQQTQKNLQEIDNDLQKKKKNLIKQIGVVQSKLKQINKKNDEIQNRIYEIMQQSLRKLEKITKNKMSLLMSDHIELKRQLDKIQWMEKYLHFEHEVLSPNDFLLSFSRYQSMKKDMIADKFEVSNVMPDMRVEGYINVLTEEEARIRTDGAQGHGGRYDPDTIKKTNPGQYNKLNRDGIFQKSDLMNDQVIKSKIQWNEPIQGKQQIVKSRNNLLNLSILRHI